MSDPSTVETDQWTTATNLFPRQSCGHQPSAGGDSYLNTKLANFFNCQGMGHWQLAIFGQQSAIKIKGEEARAHSRAI